MSSEDRHYVTLDSQLRLFVENTKAPLVYCVHNVGPHVVKLIVADVSFTLAVGDEVDIAPEIGERVAASTNEVGQESLVWFCKVSPTAP